jgi:putative SOS response-associated peptidase YedK
MSLAGLWSEWTDNSTGEIISTFSVITTGANDLMADIHNSKKRMPVVLEKGSETTWLDISSGKAELSELMRPYPSEVLKAHTISDLVNRKTAERNSPDVIKPFTWGRENRLF